MSTKLTLSIDEEVVRKAKEYSKASGRSLSSLIESYLIGLTSSGETNNEVSTPLTSKLLGSIKGNVHVDIEKILTDNLKATDD